MSFVHLDQEMNQFEFSYKYCTESNSGDSGFLSGTSSATISSSSDVSSNNFSEDNLPIKNGNDFGLSESLNQLSLNQEKFNRSSWDSKTQLNTISELDSGNVSKDFISEKEVVCQEPWELYFTQNEDGDTFLHTAIIQNWLEASLKIISMTPHPCLFDILNDDTQTALHLAVMTNQPKVVRSLVLAGADLSIRNGQGNTALHLACISGDLECAKALTDPITSSKTPKQPQNLEQRNYNGETCLHIASSKDHVDLVNLLIHLGADLEAQECLGGRTALHLALEHGCLRTVLYLIQECQPHLEATTYSGYTALQIATCVDEQIANELIKFGATPLIMHSEEDEINDFKEMSGFITPTIA